MNIFGIELTDVVRWLLAVAVVVIGWFVTNRFAINRNRHSNSQSAADKLAEAFLPELSALASRAGTDHSTRDLLVAAFDRHQLVVASYERYLVGHKRRKFRNAWDVYHYGQNFDPVKFGLSGKDTVLLQYLALTGEEELAAKQLAIKNIHGLLALAKHS